MSPMMGSRQRPTPWPRAAAPLRARAARVFATAMGRARDLLLRSRAGSELHVRAVSRAAVARERVVAPVDAPRCRANPTLGSDAEPVGYLVGIELELVVVMVRLSSAPHAVAAGSGALARTRCPRLRHGDGARS